MMPATLVQVHERARRDGIGIGMFNIVNLEFAEAIYDAAVETNLPVMFGVPERFMQFYDVECVARACQALIARTDVPIAIHLDHGKTFEGVMRALQCGFSSVMFDGSALPYEENVAKTAEIVRIAHAMGVSVEGELGYVGRVGVDEVTDDALTKPEQAEDFVRRTGVDALAIAIGNQHGQYKGTPKLDFPRLESIRAAVDCALVLHGGSGISDEDFVRAIRAGISKVNIYTAMDVAARELTQNCFAEFGAYLDYTREIKHAVRDVVKRHMLLFASAAR